MVSTDRTSLGARLRAASSLVPPVLVDTGGMASILDVLHRLPGALSSSWVFECRMGDAATRADLELLVDDAGGGHRLLAALDATGDRSHVAWRTLIEFARRWVDRAEGLHDLVLWLEFDTARTDDGRRPPTVFFQPGAGRRVSLESVDGTPAPTTGWWDARDLDRVLSYWPLAAPTRSQLDGCLARLPPSVGIGSVGAMDARGTDAARLTLGRLNITSLEQVLDRLGWQGRGRDWQAFVDLLPPFASQLQLNLDVGATVGRRLSVECCWQSPPSVWRGDPRWHAWIDGLVTRGLARPDKVRALFAECPAVTERDAPAGLWPADLQDLSSLFGPARRSVFWWAPRHIKLGYEADRPIECKAYFLLMHLWAPVPVR